jgi:hypothetical protein
MGPGTVHIKHKNYFQGNQKILQLFQIEKSSSGLQIEAVELENLITLSNGKCKKKKYIYIYNTLPFPLGCIQNLFL